MLRKFICRHQMVSVINTVSLKGIKQLVFEQQTFGVCQVFQIYRQLYEIVKNLYYCHIVIGQYKIELCLWGGVNIDTHMNIKV